MPDLSSPSSNLPTGFVGPSPLLLSNPTNPSNNPLAGPLGLGAINTLSGGQSAQQSTNQSQQQSNSYIPDYSQTPILESIAQQAQSMAPQVYQWGMNQFSKNQGNIDSLMGQALDYASPGHLRASMGMAEAGVQQGAEAGRQSAIQDLQSYGIDPSAGRYAGLDQANRVMTGAAAAGAGNQQRMADIATSNAMQNQAISSGLQNTQLGYGAATGANQLLGTGMQLNYSPLGTQSSGSSTGQSTGSSTNFSEGAALPKPTTTSTWGTVTPFSPQPTAHTVGLAGGGAIPDSSSPTDGAAVDDVPANLTAGEFVIPKDVTAWKGQEFFYKLMAQARKTRATAGNDSPAVGYGAA
jgi:hypothetical protein